MKGAQALIELIHHVNASDKPIHISWDAIEQWQEGVLNRFVALGLLAKDINSKSLTCLGCDYHCYMDVLLAEDHQRAFIVCDHPDKQSEMGRIPVPMQRLQQWTVDSKQFAVLIARLLGIDSIPSYEKNTVNYKLGMLKAKEGRRWVLLRLQPLRLDVGGHSLPVEDLLFFSEGNLRIDLESVESLLNAKTVNIGKRYASNVNKQEARKLATQAMYQNWCDAYQSLRLKNPNKTDSWCAAQISKMPIAQGKSLETIRKNMKK
jgi:hypothetical protein